MDKQHTVLGRREFLFASGSLALVGTIDATSAQGKAFPEGVATITRCPPSGNLCVKYLEGSIGESLTDLAAVAQQCVTTAKGCVDHFTGDWGMGAQDSDKCLELAKAVIAGCGAVGLLAESASPYLARFAVSAVEICEACASHCNKFKDHKTCVECANACRRFIRECRQVIVTVDYDL